MFEFLSGDIAFQKVDSGHKVEEATARARNGSSSSLNSIIVQLEIPSSGPRSGARQVIRRIRYCIFGLVQNWLKVTKFEKFPSFLSTG